MRAAALAVISLMALGACSPGGGSASSGGSSTTSAAASGGGMFPSGPGPSYKQQATMTINGQSIPEVIYHDGGKIRTEMSGPMGPTTMIMNADTHEAYSLVHIGGRTMATRMDLSQSSLNPVSPDQMDKLRADMQHRAHQIGACSAAGENGSEWEISPPADAQGAATTTSTQRSMCITSDGIMLQMKMNGAVVFDTTSVQRGPQDPSLFALPAGVQVTTIHAPSQSELNDMIARAKAAAGTH